MAPVTQPEPQPLSPASFAPVRQCLDKITAASTDPGLIDLLDKVEPDAATDAAVDNLSEAASAYLEEVERAAQAASGGSQVG